MSYVATLVIFSTHHSSAVANWEASWNFRIMGVWGVMGYSLDSFPHEALLWNTVYHLKFLHSLRMSSVHRRMKFQGLCLPQIPWFLILYVMFSSLPSPKELLSFFLKSFFSHHSDRNNLREGGFVSGSWCSPFMLGKVGGECMAVGGSGRGLLQSADLEVEDRAGSWAGLYPKGLSLVT